LAPRFGAALDVSADFPISLAFSDLSMRHPHCWAVDTTLDNS
jgi:hypothetical protein